MCHCLVKDDMKTGKENKMAEEKEIKNEEKLDIPVRTVGDYIVHPIVAFRPAQDVKQEEIDLPEGKQADGVSSTTTAPWPVFGLGYGQAIGSSVSNLAGQITGWINDRIQIPAQESTTAAPSTISTTARPDVIVRVQHRPSIAVNDRRKRPNRISLNDIQDEEEDYEQDENDFEDEEDYGGDDLEDEEVEEVQQISRPQNQGRPVRKQQRRPQQNRRQQQNRRPINNKRRQQYNRFDDYAEDDSDDDYYYMPQVSNKRAQQNAFAQLGHQSLINQIRLLTRGQTPGQITETMQKTDPDRQQGTFLVRRNGQTVYLAPELLAEEEQQQAPTYQFVTQDQVQQFPQPPLTKPLKVNGQIQQYITIPYNQLGLAPPSSASAVAEGIQNQPLILTIPQSAFDKIQNNEKSETPLVTPNAVPLLTEASLANIFKPPQIPPSRTVPSSQQNTKTQGATYTPVVVFTKNGGTKVRPSTVVEKSPSLNIKQVKTEEAYIIVNDDNEEQGRHAKHSPKRGDARVYQLPKGGRFALRNGRTLDQNNSPAMEQQIPVKIVEETPKVTEMSESTQFKDDLLETELHIVDSTPKPITEKEMEAEMKKEMDAQIVEDSTPTPPIIKEKEADVDTEMKKSE